MTERLLRNRLRNLAHSFLYLTGMAGLLSMLGWLLAGESGVLMAVVTVVVAVLVNPSVSPRLILRMYRAHPLDPMQAPELHTAVRELAQRAALPRPPDLYYVPSDMINAFSVGTQKQSAVALTHGILEHLDTRELVGVLAHEVSHIRNRDTWLMGIADLFSRMTSTLSLMGQFLLFVNLPLLMMSQVTISWFAILLLIFAPTLSALLQLALSRTREFEADLSAAELTGDPMGLASALEKLERYQGRFMEQIFLPGARIPDPSILRTHPDTAERVRRLMELVEKPGARTSAVTLLPSLAPRKLLEDKPPRRRPRWHANGLWY